MSENYKNDHMIEVRAQKLMTHANWNEDILAMAKHFISKLKVYEIGQKVQDLWPNHIKQIQICLPECHYAITCS